MCGSERNLDGERIFCNRRYNHPKTERHRGIASDLTVIVWDGAESIEIPPRVEQVHGDA